MVNQNNQPKFEVEYKEKKQLFSASNIAEMIYKKMMGKVLLPLLYYKTKWDAVLSFKAVWPQQ